jgi:hypothetical protein
LFFGRPRRCIDRPSREDALAASARSGIVRRSASGVALGAASDAPAARMDGARNRSPCRARQPCRVRRPGSPRGEARHDVQVRSGSAWREERPRVATGRRSSRPWVRRKAIGDVFAARGPATSSKSQSVRDGEDRPRGSSARSLSEMARTPHVFRVGPGTRRACATRRLRGRLRFVATVSAPNGRARRAIVAEVRRPARCAGWRARFAAAMRCRVAAAAPSRPRRRCRAGGLSRGSRGWGMAVTAQVAFSFGHHEPAVLEACLRERCARLPSVPASSLARLCRRR